MELPQSHSFGPQGRNPTHDFLSLYSPAQQDPTLTPPGDGFTLWEESAGKKGKTGKENIAGNSYLISEGGMKIGGVPWTTSVERPSQSSSIHNHPTTNISSLSSSRHSAQKHQSFVDKLKSAKPSQEDEYDDDGEFVIKTETSSHLKAEVETKPDQKPNILRSKHSATEQRRRCKINDRFSMLREIIPHGDQKRDKASFLLEVIEYIKFLQEKVHKYEDSYQGWSSEPPKIIPWTHQRPTEGFTDQPQVPNGVSEPALVYAAKLDENKSSVAPNIHPKGQNILDSVMSSLDAIKEIDQHPPCLTKEASPFTAALQPNIFGPCCGSTSTTAPLSRHEPDTANAAASQHLRQLCYSRSCATDCSDKLKDQELIIENGTIRISAIYSQGLLSSLTQALQSCGVELSQASISIQIELGKRANPNSLKRTEGACIDELVARSSSWKEEEENDKALKRFKTSIN